MVGYGCSTIHTFNRLTKSVRDLVPALSFHQHLHGSEEYIRDSSYVNTIRAQAVIHLCSGTCSYRTAGYVRSQVGIRAVHRQRYTFPIIHLFGVSHGRRVPDLHLSSMNHECT